ncbi:MAG: alanine racemase [Brevinema sp.]
MLSKSLRASRAEINTSKLLLNIRKIHNHIGINKQICLAVKANAYGHGLIGVADATKDVVDYFAVAIVDEAIALRQAGIKNPILILSPFLADEIPLVFEYDLIPVLSHGFFLDQFQQYATQYQKKLPIHLKINTGMNRNGFEMDEVLPILEKIDAMDCFELEGVCTHLAISDEPTLDAKQITLDQVSRFQDIVSKIKDKFPRILVHAANTGGALFYEESLFDMVRVGLGAYGFPSKSALDLDPVMSFKSKIVLTKHIKKGEFVSYGATWYADTDTHIALVPVGYADGIFRSLSNQGQVKIAGGYFPIIGRICMDLMLVDLGDNQFEIGEDVLIFGDDEVLNAETIAQECGTISYEIISKIANRVPRIYKF